MRIQKKKFNALLTEFNKLKAEIFKGHLFVIMDNSAQEERYNQLFAFFYPCYRTKTWINPLNQ